MAQLMDMDTLDVDDILMNSDDDGDMDLGLGGNLSMDFVDQGTIDNLDFDKPRDMNGQVVPKLEMDKTLLDDDALDKNAQPSKNKGGDPDDTISTTDTATHTSDDLAEFISGILATKGIKHPSKIPFHGEKEGEIEYMDFNDLDHETQMNILTSTQEIKNDIPSLNEDETQLIQYLRENELTVEELLERQRASILEELGEQVGKIDFDSISDEELYVLEMQSSYEISEEDALANLELEQQNPELFKKKIDKLRNDYKIAELNRVEQEQAEAIAQREQEHYEYGQELFEVAKTVDHIGGLTLNDEEKGEILDAVLDLDGNGQSQLAKIFQDKEALFRLTWFALKGEEAFSKLHTYYKEIIEQTRKEAKKTTDNNGGSGYKVRFNGKGNKTNPKNQTKDDGAFSVDDYVQ